MTFIRKFKKNYFSIPDNLKYEFFREITEQNVRLFRYILGIFIVWLSVLIVIDIRGVLNIGSIESENYLYPDIIMLIIAVFSFFLFLPRKNTRTISLRTKDLLMNIIIFTLTIWSAYVNYIEELTSEFAYTLILTYLLIIMLHIGSIYKYLLFTIPSVILYLILHFSKIDFTTLSLEMKLPVVSVVVFGLPLYWFIYSTRIRNFLFRKKIFEAYRKLRKENSKRIKIEGQLRNSKIELQEQLEKEKELNSLKIDFINMISHQYRTPLTIILSSSYLIDLRTKELNDPKIDRHVMKIQSSANQMIKLLENVITIGKNDSGRSEEHITNFDLIQYVKKIFRVVNEDYKNDHKLKIITSHDEVYLRTKSWHLNNILSNLISNAIKFSPDNHQTDVIIDDRDKYINLTVKDYGIGIPEGLCRNGMFTGFIRGENVGTIPGFGLGMNIVKQSAEKIDAIIDVKSEINQGTEIKLSIPQQ